MEAQWLGYERATDAEIAKLEKKLKTSLPPSYRSFLQASNGWRNWGAFIYELWPCAKVAWFRQRNQDWIDAYIEAYDEAGDETEVSDKEYFVYGEKQDCCRFRTEYLKTALEISAVGDSAILLLNPQVVDKRGEWEAWFFANWLPGANRYRSFRELMEAEHQTFLKLLKDQPQKKAKNGAAGQQAARDGKTDEAIAILRETAQTDPSSAASLAELYAFRGEWETVIECFACLLKSIGEIPNVEDYHRNLIHLLGRAGRETQNWKAIARIAREAIECEKKRHYDDGHEYRRETMLRIYENLGAYCRRKGKPPHELMRIFGNPHLFEDMTVAERQKWFTDAVAQTSPKVKTKAADFAAHQFSLARNVGLDDALIRAYESSPSTFVFLQVVDVARVYVRQGKTKKAWEVIEPLLETAVIGMPEWVAPIVLLVDETLSPLLTPARCAKILATPRLTKPR